MKAVLVVLVLAFVACCVAQNRPSFPEVFETNARLEVTVIEAPGRNKTFHGRGNWRSDQPANKGIENFEFETNSNMSYHVIQRYDLHQVYRIGGVPRKCLQQPVQGAMPKVWQWIASATFAGTRQEGNRKFDLWRYAGTGFELLLGVDINESHKPAFLQTSSPKEVARVWFDSWETKQPNPQWFTVPSICEHH